MTPIWDRLDVRLQRYALCLLRGMKNSEIAAEMGVSVNAVKNRMQQLLDVTGAESRLQCANLLAQEQMKYQGELSR